MSKSRLLLGTRKGLVVMDRSSKGFTRGRAAHEGQPIAYAVHDARHDTLWAAIDHGHWGQKLSRSRDAGESWEEVAAPKYPEGETVVIPFGGDGNTPKKKPATLEYIWVIQPGAADQPGRLYLGTCPGGLFRSDDGGDSFELVRGLWDHPSREAGGWFGGGRDTPGIHSVVIDPRDSRRLLVGVSCAGVFESTDDCVSWEARNKGLRADFLPDPSSEFGQDPHFVALCPSQPDVVWQQHHCGIFRSTDGAANWEEISQEKGPARFGFPVAPDEKDPLTAWVVPGVSDQQRMAVDGALCVSRTTDGGKSWMHLREGLPQKDTWDVVYRHALDIDGDRLVFGSTTGNVYFSEDRGESWRCLGNNFPPIYSVRFAA